MTRAALLVAAALPPGAGGALSPGAGGRRTRPAVRAVRTALLAMLPLLGAAGDAPAARPAPEHAQNPGAPAVAAEAVTFPAADSLPVSGWWLAGPAGAPAVVIGGRGAGSTADRLPAARAFLERGFAVLTFDYRGCGPGHDPATDDSLRTIVFASAWVDDMLGALRYARSRAGSGRHVFAWGQDPGGAVAVAAAARERRSCDAVATEGLFRTAQDHLRMLGTSTIPHVAERHGVLVRGGDDPISACARLMVPLLTVLAGRDDVTPPTVTRQVAARCLVRWESWAIPEAKHEGAEQTPGYFDRIAAWFKRWTAFPAGGS
ncbi:MAG: hypothetical protein HZC42_00505 [Candidatus Eisenbacteria bacterium]|nr:hypothetical protein [Candidatus Eisenbacteria bacterium]